MILYKALLANKPGAQVQNVKATICTLGNDPAEAVFKKTPGPNCDPRETPRISGRERTNIPSVTVLMKKARRR